LRFLKPILFLLCALPILAWAQDAQTAPEVEEQEQDKGYLNQALNMPTETQTVVEYQPSTGCYVLHTKIGNTDITTPILMTADEYKAYTEQQFIHKYWQQKIGEVEHDNEKKFDITDMKFNIGPADKVFGPGGVKLKLQGSAELLFGFKHQYIDNPSLTQRSRNNNIFDFDEKIQLNVNGTVGTRLSLQMNYNTEASFAADQQNIKLSYKGEEDDIIQSIQAGNVTLDLNSSLIKGSQALFGIKTDLKFGRLKVQALISQQNSQTQSASSEGGAQMTKFEVQADNYDENKHFFLSYYFRDHYETALQSLPYVTGGVTINRIEVWVTNKRGTYDQARNIIAFTDLGEGNPQHMLNPNTAFVKSSADDKPYNDANNLYSLVKDIPAVRDIQQVTSYLQDPAHTGGWSIYGHDFTGGEDYDKIESARLLTTSEYTLNSTLGYISLKTSLQQDEVLAVAFEYTYGGKVYQVGEFSSDQNNGSQAAGNRAPNLILKMLRSSNTAPIPMISREKERYGTWHLMMKNIYSLGASSMTSEKFELYVKYRNDSIGQEVQYLPEGEKTKGKQLIRVLNADRLDQRNNPYPDGRFDYVEGYTVLSSMGRIIFPVLEPFGSHLASQIDPTLTNTKLINKYCFQELYDSTLVIAQEMSEKNKYVLTGKYKGTNSSEIRLNAMNIPRGSVTVTAGGATLVENVDYTVDYTMGVVTILNQSLIESGTNIDVQLENQSTFGMQRRGLYGVHMEYEFSKDFTIGGTLMHLRESPLTTKVNLGSEPLANTIWGLNLNYRTEMMWLTNLLDKIPWMQVTAPSTFQIGAEFAQLIPGHTKDVGQEGTSYIDDFESTTTAIDVHYPSNWFLSSTPVSKFAEGKLGNSLEYNKNRALLNWYIVDPIFGHAQTNTPQHIKDDPNILSDHRTRIVYQQELFPNKESLANEDTRLSVLNLTFYPKEHGPYNISPNEYNAKGELTSPETRWGGMMRRLDNTDFERANIEYIEFWLMDPKLTNSNYTGAKLYIDLGDVSEDILKDGKKSFEHGLPINPDDETMVEKTIWGRIPRTTSTTVAFSNEAGARDAQDVGLNGLSTAQEFAFEYNGQKPYAEYVDQLRQTVTDPTTIQRWNNDPFSPFRDPAGDNYHYYRGDDYDEAATPVLERYKHYNGVEGNSPESGGQTYGTASTLTPDIEDINHDNTLGEYEKYYEYEVSLDPSTLASGGGFISEKMVTDVTLKNGRTDKVTWYKFKVPIHSDSCHREGGIRNFKSIRFMRVYLTGCSDTTTLRFATMDLVRGEWRNYTKGLYNDEKNDLYNTTLPSSNSSLDVQAVSIEQDGKRSPVNYVLPPGISRQTDPGQAQLISQNEQALVLRVHNLDYNNAKAVYKSLTMDMRNYKQLKMFVHAESLVGERVLQDDELSCFIRLGTDMTSNYYEYEVPLEVTPASTTYNNDNEEDRKKVWPESNNINFPFSALTNAKTARNKAKRNGNTSVSNTKPYVIYDDANGKPNNRITVLGNPTLEDVEYIVIGVRNRNGASSDKSSTLDGEVWVNELRLSEFDEEGGVAAMANMALGISDIAQLNMSGRVETAGYGSIESNVQNRNMDNYYQFQVSAAMELGRFFPEKAKLRIPLYVSYSKNLNAPKYDPTDTDIKLKESLETYNTDREKDSIKNMANTVQESTSWSLTNFKVDIHSKKKNMFYDPANFTLSVAFNKQDQASPEIEKDFSSEHKGSFNYAYSFNPKPWEPFKKLDKVKNVKILTEFNLYYLPQSWSFNTDMHRSFTQLKMRDFNQTTPNEQAQSENMSYSKDFTWNRNFDFKYDLTKNLKFSFHTAMNSTVDEGLYTPEIIKDYNFTNDYYEAWKDTVMRSMKTWGQPYTYQQVFTATWNIPFNRIPYMDWLTANASYNGTYTWNRTASTSSKATNYGNTAQSSRAWQADGQANLETLYGKSNYWKQLNQRMSGRQNKRPFRAKVYSETVNLTAGEPLTLAHQLNSENLLVTAVDKNGKSVRLTFKADGGTKVIITSHRTASDVNVTVTTRDPNQRTAAEKAMDFAAYFGTMIRRVQVTYRQTDALTVPGFMPQVGFMGQSNQGGGLYAPGWDFAFGFFPTDYVERARDRGWLALSDSISQPATMARTSDFDVKITLEPFPGFKIQVNGKRYESRNSSLLYTKDLNRSDNFYAIQETMNGSYNITQVAIASAFEKVGKPSDNFTSATFNRFLANRDIMQNRVQQRYNDVYYPTSDPSQLFGDTIQGQKYDANLGTVSKNSADVLVPAFLTAYTKQDANKVSFNPFMDILHILPNWNVTFDGLGRIPAIKEHFKSFVLTHAYTCKYAIGSYTSYSAWLGAGDGKDKTLGFRRDAVSGNPVPSSAYDISSASLTESFSPLIGVNMTLKNSLLIKTEYRTQRTATLNVSAVQLTEGNTQEFVLGTGYTVKDLHFTAKAKNGTQRKVSNDLKITADFSYKNVATLLRKVEENLTQASSGNKVWGLKIGADYVISQKVNVQFYYDHQSTIPLISSSYPIKNDNLGINIKLMLTR